MIIFLLPYLLTKKGKDENLRGSALQTLKEMQKWQGLLARKNVQQNLSNERDMILDGLINQANITKEEYESRSGQTIDPQLGMESIPQGHNFSKTVNSIIWVRQLSFKLKKMTFAANTFLSDLKKFESFKKNAEEQIESMKEFENEQFDNWKAEILGILKQPNNELCLQLNGQLMELETEEGYNFFYILFFISI